MLLVLGCVAGFVVITVTSGERVAVLALARPVGVGRVLTAQDLREVAVSVDAGVSTVPASQASTVVGQTVATSLPAGSLLSPAVLGAASIPGEGRAVAALALKPGQFPVEISPGARVLVVFVPNTTAAPASTSDSSGPSAGGSGWPATVLSVSGPAAEQTGQTGQSTVVSVELDEPAAQRVAAVPAGQLSLVLLSAGGSR